MRALILWADDRSANLGVRVLAQGTETLAREVWGGDIDVDFQDLGPNRDGFMVTVDAVKRDFGRRNGPIKTWLRHYDLVLDTGAGDSFTDIYGLNRLARMAYTQRTAQNLGIPVVMIPQTIGPFSDMRTRPIARSNLKRMTVVAARDKVSADYALQLGRPCDVLSTDVVFVLPRPTVRRSRDLLINVSGLLWEPNSHVAHNEYRSHVRALIETAIRRGREVSLLAHVLDNPSKDNDAVPISTLEAEYGSRLEAIIPQSLDEARRVVASARLVVGSRMHACLNALSCGTPSIPWAYSRKFAPLMNDIGWPYSVDLRTDPEPVPATFRILDEVGEGGLESAVADLGNSTAARIAALKSELARVRVSATIAPQRPSQFNA